MVKSKETPEGIAFVREHIGDMSNSAIARHLNVSPKTVYVYAKKYGIRRAMSRSERIREAVRRDYITKSQSQIAREQHCTVKTVQNAVKEMGLVYTDEIKAARVASNAQRNKCRYKMEKWRVFMGMKQETRLHLCLRRKGSTSRYYYLIYRRNYFLAKRGDTTLWYDKETRRSPKEAYYTERWGIRFENAEDDETESQQCSGDTQGEDA